MKPELKTAEQYVSEIKPVMGNLEYCAKNGKINGSIALDIKKAIESHTSERLDHVRQQLEEMKETFRGVPSDYTKGKSVAYSEAISLIDQIKSEKK